MKGRREGKEKFEKKKNFQTKRRKFLNRKKRESGEVVCCINLILINLNIFQFESSQSVRAFKN